MLRKLQKQTRAFLVAIASLSLFALMTLMFFDVVLRSAFNMPIEAATELTRCLMALVVFAVLPIISTSGGQISVDLLDGVFHRLRLVRIRDAVIALVSGAALIEPARRIWILADRAREYGETTEYLNIPTYLLGSFVFLSVLATSLALIVHGIAVLFGKHSSEGAKQ